MTAARLLLVGMAALLFILIESRAPGMTDLGIYLAQGRDMAESGGLADVDRWTHTVEGVQYVNAAWLSQVIFFRVLQVFGFGALRLLPAIAAAATVLLVGWRAGKISPHGAMPAAAGAICCLLIVQSTGLRPELFALPLFAIYAGLAMGIAPDRRTMLASAAISTAWVNLHGSFPIAPVLSLLVAAGALLDRRSRDAAWHVATAGAAVAGTLINPWGPAIYRYVLDNPSVSEGRNLTEWAAPTLRDPTGWRLLGAAALVLAACAATRRLPARRDIPPLLGFLALALTGMRYGVWLGMIVPFVLVRMFPEPEPEAERLRPLRPLVVRSALALVCVAMIAMSPPVRTGRREVLDPRTPVALTEWAEANGVAGRLFNPMEWGSLLAWRLHPRTSLFVDERIWIYPDDVWSDFMTIAGAKPGWEETLDRRAVDWVLVDTKRQPNLANALAVSTRWKSAYQDELGAIYSRP